MFEACFFVRLPHPCPLRWDIQQGWPIACFLAWQHNCPFIKTTESPQSTGSQAVPATQRRASNARCHGDAQVHLHQLLHQRPWPWRGQSCSPSTHHWPCTPTPGLGRNPFLVQRVWCNQERKEQEGLGRDGGKATLRISDCT